MRRKNLFLALLGWLFVQLSLVVSAEQIRIHNDVVVATFGQEGLRSLEETGAGPKILLTRDAWSMTVDGVVLRSTDGSAGMRPVGIAAVVYSYDLSGYRVDVTYRIRPGWHFVSKELRIVKAPRFPIEVKNVVPWDVAVQDEVGSVYVPSSYLPQFGETIEQSRQGFPAKDFGAFLRLGNNRGVMLTVQNPLLEVNHAGNSATIAYSPDMQWKMGWGDFAADPAVVGIYNLSGERLPREMTLEWRPSPDSAPRDGMDRAEIEAFRDCVRAFLVNPAASPNSVEVGWTLNDYQIDVGTPEGRAEYRRIIDSASSLGIRNLLYAPGNSSLAQRTDSADTWSWEYVLWLNMGQKIRKGEWNPASDPIPREVTQMVAYAKSKNVGLLAYVYPSIPYEGNAAWLVKKSGEDKKFSYATLASREFQDYLLHNLIEFQRRTGIAGYSFDYTWLNLPGSSTYAQWFGWKRVMAALRRASPSIVIDGRQSYQQYGPWSWLAGSYPHPTGTDEQPESFKPYPDLHFDRVSADRARFVNYWYRNYQFAPAEVIPGYATHQTERSINIPSDGPTGGHSQKEETVYTRYLPRDWDYLGYRYSFISSIATGGWNNVVDMIPARDPEELRYFSGADQAWIRRWLAWTTDHKEYLRNTRTILDQPSMGHVDGTSAIVGDHGYIFLFNPNYNRMSATFVLNKTVGLSAVGKFALREIYPDHGRTIGKPGEGVWSSGDSVHLDLDGTSATVLEVVPKKVSSSPFIFNVATAGDPKARASLIGKTLAIRDVAGEVGTSVEIGVLMPSAAKIQSITVNGHEVRANQSGRYVGARVQFAGTRFGQAEQVLLSPSSGGKLTGSFIVPQRILNQLAARKRAWPIPWTQQDYETTWLAPERLLLFVQFAEGKDDINVSASVDGEPLSIKAAYSSTRVHPASFVGFYADVSGISAEKPHDLSIKIPADAIDKLRGVFFDNVESSLTQEIVP